MVEFFAVNEDVAGSSPASPATFDAEKVINALLDYQWDQILKKHNEIQCSLEEAVAMQMADIMAAQ